MSERIECENGDLKIGDIIIPASKRQKTEVYSRVVGYMRPVSSWNKGKKAEWADRKLFDARKALEQRVSTNGAVRRE